MVFKGEIVRAPLYTAMDRRWTLQVAFLSLIASCQAQNFQPSGGFQPQVSGPGGFQSQRGAPQGLTGDQREAVRAQDDFRKSVAEVNRAVLKPKRPPHLEQPNNIRTVPQQFAQVQVNPVATQEFQGTPQPQGQVRTQTPVKAPAPRPPQAVRQQQTRQPIRPPTQGLEQPQVSRQQFEQPTAQQVNQQFFESTPEQNFEHPQQPVQVVRRPSHPPQPERPGVARTQSSEYAFDPELFRQQAENARYSFAAAVTDTINDQENIREETRDGLNLRGLYSYSDGYYKRTVHYEADENGYRVVKEEVDAIGDGPKGDPNGRAEVSANVQGNNLQYSITAADLTSRAGLSHAQAQQEHQPFSLT